MADSVVIASASRTTNGSVTVALPGNLDLADFILDVTARSGTTPTLDVIVTESVPGAATARTITLATFTQATGGTGLPFTEKKTIGAVATPIPLPEQVTISWTVGGTTPNWTFSVGMITRRNGR